MHRTQRILLLIFVIVVVVLFAIRRTRMQMFAPAPPAQPQSAAPISQPPAAPAPEAATPQFHAAHIYNETADAKEDIQGALALAQSTNRNVLLDFGANWCPDCQMLDVYFHQPPNSDLLEKNYILVHVDMGRLDKNLDVAYTFNVPIKKGIPALAVVSPTGRVIFSQTAGEFENMRNMPASSVTEFLKMWRPKGH
jgi:thiol:disulfide interchange protein